MARSQSTSTHQNLRVHHVRAAGLALMEGAPASPGDKKDDGFDTDVAIATGELGNMLPELLEALGGEMALP